MSGRSSSQYHMALTRRVDSGRTLCNSSAVNLGRRHYYVHTSYGCVAGPGENDNYNPPDPHPFTTFVCQAREFFIKKKRLMSLKLNECSTLCMCVVTMHVKLCRVHVQFNTRACITWSLFIFLFVSYLRDTPSLSLFPPLSETRPIHPINYPYNPSQLTHQNKDRLLVRKSSIQSNW